MSTTTTPTPGGLVKLTVFLTARAWAALTSASKITHDSKTDSLNRAVVLYDKIAKAEPGTTISFQRRRGELIVLSVARAGDKR